MVGVLEERRREEEEEGHADVDVVNAVVVVVGQSHGFSSMMETNRVSARGRRAGVGRTIWVACSGQIDGPRDFRIPTLRSTLKPIL